MNNSIFLFSFLIIVLFSCETANENKSTNNKSDSINKFSDENILEIAKAQYRRDKNTLLSYFDSENSEYREAAAMAFASVQDSLFVLDLAKLLHDEDMKVRIAAAFAIGQSAGLSGAKILYVQLLKEENDLVKKAFLEAIGKCGNKRLMQQIINFHPGFEHEDILAGKALALSRFSIRGMANEQLVDDIFKLLSSKKVSENVKYYASIALSRNTEPISDKQFLILKELYKKTKSMETQLNLVLAANKNLSDSSLIFLYSVFETAKDYRLRINALRSLSAFDYEKVRDIYFTALYDKNVNVAIRASEYFIDAGISDNVDLYLQKAKQINNWRVSANLFLAANRYAGEQVKQKISKIIIEKYQASGNNYEKAWLLKALGGNAKQWQFIEKEIFTTKVPVIRSMGMDALATVYDLVNRKDKSAGQQFVPVFKKAVLSGDVALISVASGILRNPDFGFKQIIDDYEFLKIAANKLQLPKELEAYLELQKTLVYFRDSGKVEFPKIKYKKINWKEVKNIEPDQKVSIKTSKGDIIIRLDVEDNPATVATFIELIKSGFYTALHIHRVVPNFVIQDGCPRGDGWGSPDFSIRSEFYNSYYGTGALGMASAGKDTESSQWFITHSPTPHLDGRYTLFGKVIEGMDVVHKIEVGDEIYNIELIDD
ncbi:MAG: peptidylprolyl isomerase [Bacteroidales bacterium]|nr:peptidylprolyl isomerase [Bacteroidales bacterium]